jgi:hypothetical protein
VSKERRFERTDGSYQLEGLEPGVYEVATAEQGYADRKIEVVAGITADFDLAPWVSVTGKLVAVDDRPVARARLMPYGEAFRGGQITAHTDSQGFFRFPKVPSGETRFDMVAEDGTWLYPVGPDKFDIGTSDTDLGQIKVAGSE